MSNKFVPGMILLSGTISPGRTGDYEVGGSGDPTKTYMDDSGNTYFSDGDSWWCAPADGSDPYIVTGGFNNSWTELP